MLLLLVSLSILALSLSVPNVRDEAQPAAPINVGSVIHGPQHITIIQQTHHHHYYPEAPSLPGLAMRALGTS